MTAKNRLRQIIRVPVRLLVALLLLSGVLIAQPGAAVAAPPTGQLLTNSPLSGVTAPSASWTSNGGRIDVFEVGSDGWLYQRYWTSGSGWQGRFAFAPPAAGIGSAPSATWTSGGGRIDVFVTGSSDGHLYQKYWTSGSGWSGWVDLGGVLISAPSASWTSNGGRIDVFGIGTDGRLYQKYWTSGSGWQGWFGFAAPAAGIGSAPSITWTTGGGRIDVFVTGANDGRLYQKYWTSGSGWSGWVDLG